MSVGKIKIGEVSISRMIIGGNPFSGYSHQTEEKDDEMKHFYTAERIKEALRKAEKAGINTHIGRADNHIVRVLMEYWDEGGQIQWIAQTCPGVGSMELGIRNAVRGGAKGCFLHGGMMDKLLGSGELDEVPAAINKIKDAGLIAGIAGHDPKVHEWAQANLDVDFHMCSYYNSAHRDEQGRMASGMAEWFHDEDRRIMVDLIQRLSRPVIHYKVMAAGRNDPGEALRFVAEYLRPQDAVCVGVYLKDNPEMLGEDICLLAEALAKTRAVGD